MAKTLRAKKSRRRWSYPFIIVILLAAAGTVLYRLPPSLQDINRILQSADGKISSFSAGQSPAESVLRGTIYDRRFNELAVSYQLYTVAVKPAEVINLQKTAEALAPHLEGLGFSRILSSDLGRAKSTTGILNLRLRLPVTLERRLREQHYGEWMGRYWRDIPEAVKAAAAAAGAFQLHGRRSWTRLVGWSA